MNLIDASWIPCVRQDSAIRMASLRDCFICDDIVDLAVRPHERVALMRLLLCVGYAAAGIPEDYDEWEALGERLPSVVPAYLDQWKESFELFHPEKPFLQVARLRNVSASAKLTPCSKLDFALATGNNSTLLDHAALSIRSFSPEWLALNLLTYQMFSPGSLIGSVMWGDKKTRDKSCDGPCACGSMLHTFLRRDTIIDTIKVNMLSKEALHGYQRLGNGWRGRPLWEQFPKNLDDAPAIHNATQTFLGRMVPLTRAVLLSSDGVGMMLGDGLTFPSYNNSQRPFPPEVTATVVAAKKKGSRTLLSAQPDKAIWRQLAALTIKKMHDNELGGCDALFYSHDWRNVDLVVCGLAHVNMDVVDVIESVFHIPSAMFQTECHDIYENEVTVAENIAQGLGEAVARYRRLLDSEREPRLKRTDPNRVHAFRHYWTAVETGLSLLWEMILTYGNEAFPVAQKAWRVHLETSACTAYSFACGKDTGRQLRAYVTGKRILFDNLRQYLEC